MAILTREIGIHEIAQAIVDALISNKEFIESELRKIDALESDEHISEEAIYMGHRKVIPFEIAIQVIPETLTIEWGSTQAYDITTNCRIFCCIKHANLESKEQFLGAFESSVRTILNDPANLFYAFQDIGTVYDSRCTSTTFGTISQGAIYASETLWFGSIRIMKAFED